MGSLDWLTTTIGILYFGAVESNPMMAAIANTNIPVFTVVKLSATMAAGLMFYQAEKIWGKTQDDSKSNRFVGYLLRGAYVASTVFLLMVVLNNVIAVAGVL